MRRNKEELRVLEPRTFKHDRVQNWLIQIKIITIIGFQIKFFFSSVINFIIYLFLNNKCVITSQYYLEFQ